MSDAPIDELEAEWSELRGGWFTEKFRSRGPGRAASAPEADRPSLWFFPVLLLYVGLFMGPFATALAAVFTMKFRIALRDAAVVLGACGSAWCLLQGLSVYNGAWWDEVELQTMRSALNFAAGVIAYVVVRPAALARYRQSLRTLWTSVLVLAIASILFVLLPSSVLIALGR